MQGQHYPEILRIRELETLARILANQYNLRLEFGPPASAPGVIYLPMFTTDMFKPPYARRMIGFLDHEAAHHLFTDFNLAEKVFPKKKKTDLTISEGLLHYLWNMWEDGTIERKIQLEFLGAKDNLSDSNGYIVDRDSKQFGKNFLSDALFYMCYTNKGCEVPVSDDVIQFCEAFNDLRKEAETTQNTQQNYDLAVRTLNRLKQLMPEDMLKDLEMEPPEEEEEQEDQNQNGTPMPGMPGQGQSSSQSQSGQQGESGQSGQQQQQQGQQQQGQQQQGQQQQSGKDKQNQSDQGKDKKDKQTSGQNGKDKKNEKDKQDGKQASGQDGKGQDKKEAIEKAKDLMKKHASEIRKDLKAGRKLLEAIDCISRKLREALEEEFKKSTARKGAGADASDVPFSVLFDTLEYVNTWNQNDKKRYETLFEEVRDECKSLRPKFIMGIRGYGEGRLEGQKKFGCKIDTRNLSRLVTEDCTEIFAQWKEDITSDMAISLVLDESGSMDSDEAAKVMLSVAEPLSYTEAKVLIASYEGTGYGSYYGNGGNQLGRCLTHIRVYKNFDERFNLIKFRFGRVSSRGSTPIPQALDFGYLSLVTRPEKRKLLILVTDGDSDGGPAATPLIRKREAAMREQGVELIAVVLMDSSYARHYKDIFPHLVSVVPGTPMAPVFVKMLHDYFKPQLDLVRRKQDDEEE